MHVIVPISITVVLFILLVSYKEKALNSNGTVSKGITSNDEKTGDKND